MWAVAAATVRALHTLQAQFWLRMRHELRLHGFYERGFASWAGASEPNLAVLGFLHLFAMFRAHM